MFDEIREGGDPLPARSVRNCVPLFIIDAHVNFALDRGLPDVGMQEAHGRKMVLVCTGPSLDDNGLLCDFHAVESALHDICAPLNNTSLNEHQLFDGVNPSAENVARLIGNRLADQLRPVLPTGTGVTAVRVTEAPGCAATYRPD